MAIDVGLEISGFGASRVEEAVENGDVDVHADGAIPVGNVVVANGSLSDNAKGRDGGALEIVFGAAEFLSGCDLVLKGENFRALLQGLLNQR